MMTKKQNRRFKKAMAKAAAEQAEFAEFCASEEAAGKAAKIRIVEGYIQQKFPTALMFACLPWLTVKRLTAIRQAMV